MSLPNTQHAAVITQFGDVDVLDYRDDVALPNVSDTQVLVRVSHAGINPVDYKTRQGLGWGAQNIQDNQFAHGLPAILGFDVSGYVVDENSQQQAVAAMNFAGGCYAQYVAVDKQVLVHIPEGVAMATAAGLPTVGVTAKQFMDFADIQAGEQVVMNAPAGGVGHVLVQLLLAVGVKLTLICSQDKYDKLASLIDRTQLAGWVDYQSPEVVEQGLPELQADVLLDLVGGQAGIQALHTLKTGARAYCLPTIWADKLAEAGKSRQLQVQGFIAKPNAADLAWLLQQVAKGELILHVDKIYPLAEVQAAHQALQQGSSFGKLVLAV